MFEKKKSDEQLAAELTPEGTLDLSQDLSLISVPILQKSRIGVQQLYIVKNTALEILPTKAELAKLLKKGVITDVTAKNLETYEQALGAVKPDDGLPIPTLSTKEAKFQEILQAQLQPFVDVGNVKIISYYEYITPGEGEDVQVEKEAEEELEWPERPGKENAALRQVFANALDYSKKNILMNMKKKQMDEAQTRQDRFDKERQWAQMAKEQREQLPYMKLQMSMPQPSDQIKAGELEVARKALDFKGGYAGDFADRARQFEQGSRAQQIYLAQQGDRGEGFPTQQIIQEPLQINKSSLDNRQAIKLINQYSGANIYDGIVQGIQIIPNSLDQVVTDVVQGHMNLLMKNKLAYSYLRYFLDSYYQINENNNNGYPNSVDQVIAQLFNAQSSLIDYQHACTSQQSNDVQLYQLQQNAKHKYIGNFYNGVDETNNYTTAIVKWLSNEWHFITVENAINANLITDAAYIGHRVGQFRLNVNYNMQGRSLKQAGSIDALIKNMFVGSKEFRWSPSATYGAPYISKELSAIFQYSGDIQQFSTFGMSAQNYFTPLLKLICYADAQLANFAGDMRNKVRRIRAPDDHNYQHENIYLYEQTINGGFVQVNYINTTVYNALTPGAKNLIKRLILQQQVLFFPYNSKTDWTIPLFILGMVRYPIVVSSVQPIYFKYPYGSASYDQDLSDKDLPYQLRNNVFDLQIDECYQLIQGDRVLIWLLDDTTTDATQSIQGVSVVKFPDAAAPPIIADGDKTLFTNWLSQFHALGQKEMYRQIYRVFPNSQEFADAYILSQMLKRRVDYTTFQKLNETTANKTLDMTVTNFAAQQHAYSPLNGSASYRIGYMMVYDQVQPNIMLWTPNGKINQVTLDAQTTGTDRLKGKYDNTIRPIAYVPSFSTFGWFLEKSNLVTYDNGMLEQQQCDVKIGNLKNCVHKLINVTQLIAHGLVGYQGIPRSIFNPTDADVFDNEQWRQTMFQDMFQVYNDTVFRQIEIGNVGTCEVGQLTLSTDVSKTSANWYYYEGTAPIITYNTNFLQSYQVQFHQRNSENNLLPSQVVDQNSLESVALCSITGDPNNYRYEIKMIGNNQQGSSSLQKQSLGTFMHLFSVDFFDIRYQWMSDVTSSTIEDFATNEIWVGIDRDWKTLEYNDAAGVASSQVTQMTLHQLPIQRWKRDSDLQGNTKIWYYRQRVDTISYDKSGLRAGWLSINVGSAIEAFTQNQFKKRILELY